MATPPLTPEQLQEAVDLVEQYGSQNRAAQVSGIPRATLQSRYYRAIQEGYLPKVDGNALSNTEGDDGYVIERKTTYVRGEGYGQWVKEKLDPKQYREKILAFAAELAKPLPKVKPKPFNPKDYEPHYMSMIVVGDPHCGMYSWAEETGSDFDIDIFQREFCGGVQRLIDEGPVSDRLVIVSVGDYFHADNLEGKTAKSGNILDMDTRLPKVFKVGVAAMRQCIEYGLKKHKTVEVVCALGNHDEVLSMAMTVLLENVYREEPRVIIHDQPTRRHYIQHGNVLIGITHGHQTKDKDLPLIMATEKAKEWGNTKYRFFFRGHHHQDKLDQFNGCTIEQFNTFAPADAYGSAHGYLPVQSMRLGVFHAKYGREKWRYMGVEELRDLMA